MMKKAYIFDVDGTLYSQKKMHIYMMVKLGCHYLIYIWRIKELLAIQFFRKFREKDIFKNCSMYEVADQVALSIKMDVCSVVAVIQKWMFDIPIRLIEKCAYKDVIDYIQNQLTEHTKIIIYSDYPAKEKVEALGILADKIYTAEDESIQELKPSKRAMTFICEELNLPKEDILYVGDRFEKDGKSAEMVGIEYCDINEFRKKICKKTGTDICKS